MKTRILARSLSLVMAALAVAFTHDVAAVIAPTNDAFVNALTFVGPTMSADIALASAEPNEPDHWPLGGDLAIQSAWWKFTPTVSGVYQIDTIGSTYDTVLAVYTGATLTTLARVAVDDTNGGGPTSLLKLVLTKGTTYRIAVDSYSSTSGTAMLNIKCTQYFAALTWQGIQMMSSETYQISSSGLFTATVSGLGSVSGKLILGGKTYPFTAAVGEDGEYIASVHRPGYMPISIYSTRTAESTITLADGISCRVTQSMDATVVDGVNVISYPLLPVGAGDGALKAFFPLVAPWSRANPCPRAGQYNLIIDLGPSHGQGVAAVTVSNTGACTGTGNLSDGTPFTFSAPILNSNGSLTSIGTDGAFYFAVSLYRGTGLIAGRVQFSAAVTPASLTGSMVWVRQPAKPGVIFLAGGVSNFGGIYGSRYTAPAPNTRLDAAFNPLGTCTMSAFSATPAFGTVMQTIMLSVLHKFSYTPPNANLIALTVAPATGMITGTFKYTETSAKTAVKAVFVRHPAGYVGFYGFVLGTTGSAPFRVIP